MPVRHETLKILNLKSSQLVVAHLDGRQKLAEQHEILTRQLLLLSRQIGTQRIQQPHHLLQLV
jgi:hypothetical protein